jgi:hypothetical protein
MGGSLRIIWCNPDVDMKCCLVTLEVAPGKTRANQGKPGELLTRPWELINNLHSDSQFPMAMNNLDKEVTWKTNENWSQKGENSANCARWAVTQPVEDSNLQPQELQDNSLQIVLLHLTVRLTGYVNSKKRKELAYAATWFECIPPPDNHPNCSQP